MHLDDSTTASQDNDPRPDKHDEAELPVQESSTTAENKIDTNAVLVDIHSANGEKIDNDRREEAQEPVTKQSFQQAQELSNSSNHVGMDLKPERQSTELLSKSCDPKLQAQNTILQGCIRRSKTLGPQAEVAWSRSNRSTSHSSLKQFRYSPDLALSEFSSLLTFFDRLTKPSSHHNVETEKMTETQPPTQLNESDFDETQTQEAPEGNLLSLEVLESTEREEEPFHKGHRRDPAATRISTSSINKPLDPTVQSTKSPRDVAILSPEPASPVRQLRRFKNSIPELMKALPPLPAEAREGSTEVCVDSFLNNNSLGTVDDLSASGFQGVNYQAEGSHLCDQKRVNPPKFKLRVKQPVIPKSGMDDESLMSSNVGQALPRERGSPPVQSKLRIKVSRSHVGQVPTNRDGTVLRSQALKECSSLADLEHCAQKELFASHRYFDGVHTDQGTESMIAGSGPVTTDLEVLRLSPQPSDQFDIQYPQVANRITLTTQPAPTSCKRVLHNSRSLDWGVNRRNQRLRQKLSFLKIRIGGAQKPSHMNDTVLPDRSQGDPVSSPTMPIGNDRVSAEVYESAEQMPAKTEGRVRRWARGAKKVMHLCVRRTLDRPTSSHN